MGDKREDIYREFEINTLLLIKAYKTLDEEDFKLAFKDFDVSGEHLWRQYSITYKCNMLSFFGYLNSVELKAILVYIQDVLTYIQNDVEG